MAGVGEESELKVEGEEAAERVRKDPDAVRKDGSEGQEMVQEESKAAGWHVQQINNVNAYLRAMVLSLKDGDLEVCTCVCVCTCVFVFVFVCVCVCVCVCVACHGAKLEGR